MLTVFVNPERCIGCMQCEFACAVEHSVTKEPAFAVSEVPLPIPRIDVLPGLVAGTSYPSKCRHCDPAPCIGVCPTGALYRDLKHDQVLLNEQACIACAMCAIVCPFDVITYAPTATSAGRTVAVKCDGCIERLRQGHTPACAEACKVNAIVFGEINDLTAAARREHAVTVLAAAATQPTPAAPDGQSIAPTVSSWRDLAEAARDVGQAGGVR
jgi:anaerobic carbon-monoxide dehydrogenase iron sulfur subunit